MSENYKKFILSYCRSLHDNFECINDLLELTSHFSDNVNKNLLKYELQKAQALLKNIETLITAIDTKD